MKVLNSRLRRQTIPNAVNRLHHVIPLGSLETSPQPRYLNIHSTLRLVVEFLVSPDGSIQLFPGERFLFRSQDAQEVKLGLRHFDRLPKEKDGPAVAIDLQNLFGAALFGTL